MRRRLPAHAAVRRFAWGRRKPAGVSRLVLLRHGQSEWNKDPTFTGWCDIPLTERGRREARQAGELLLKRGYGHVTRAFTSELSRAWETCEIVLDTLGSATAAWPTRDWRLNERMYGALQGIGKHDPKLKAKYGEQQLWEWRRSLRGRPPPLEPPPAFGPRTESLADCRDRALACFEDAVKPALKNDGDVVLLAAHSNTLRGLISHLDDVDDDEIPGLHVPNSVPIVYDFDTTTQRPRQPKLGACLDGHRASHARWLLSEENQKKIFSALQPGGLLTRALFDSWDVNSDGLLSPEEISKGLRAVSTDIGLFAIARRIVRRINIDYGGTCTLDDYERIAADVVEDLRLVEVERQHHLPPGSGDALRRQTTQ